MDRKDHRAEPPSMDEIYGDLVSLARALSVGKDCQAMPPNALVHEAWLRMDHAPPPETDDREHLLASASRIMRQVLVAESRNAKRAEEALHQELLEHTHPGGREIDREVLDEAVQRLRNVDCRLARIVELRFFAGLNNEEIGRALGVSAKTVQRDWATARAWLRRELA